MRPSHEGQFLPSTCIMSLGHTMTNMEIFSLLLRVAFLSTVSYFTLMKMLDVMDPTRKEKNKAKKIVDALLPHLGISKGVRLTEYEVMIASNLVMPRTIAISWEDIAGLDSTVKELRETVILPILKRDQLAGSSLTQAPKGVLLHGPPGCGKTMLAKAIAREAGARFINLDGSALHDKWYGESQKLAGAVFSLARKIQPCIIFIDEIDALLRSRDPQDHEATALIKSQFLQLWDGLSTDMSCTVVVMGATNRPRDVDRAIVRRMPATFHIGMPDVHQRKSILRQVLKMEDVSEDVDYVRLANLSDGFSGSDLRELCRAAAVSRVKDLDNDHPHAELRSINNEDLLNALAKMRESRVHCGSSLPTPFPSVD